MLCSPCLSHLVAASAAALRSERPENGGPVVLLADSMIDRGAIISEAAKADWTLASRPAVARYVREVWEPVGPRRSPGRNASLIG